MLVLPKLSTGLDVNVRFTGVSDFEYTPECIVFDLLNVPLYHGWLVDPQVSCVSFFPQRSPGYVDLEPNAGNVWVPQRVLGVS